jgi:hypothetical protein
VLRRRQAISRLRLADDIYPHEREKTEHHNQRQTRILQLEFSLSLAPDSNGETTSGVNVDVNGNELAESMDNQGVHSHRPRTSIDDGD